MHEVLMARPGGLDTHQLHREVYSALAEPGQPRKFIYADLGGAVVVRGDFPREIAARGRPVLQTREGEEYSFTLTAFPTVKFNGKPRSISRARAKDSLRLRWLSNRAAQHGFEVLGVPFMQTRSTTITKDESAFGMNLTTYEGRLRVTDAETFNAALRGGIGQGRAYGAGLLIINPLA